ncbi:MAG: hypothetical protein JWR80_7985 [Bradyrhizobium sp.]|nr:hypothetical protein [Bradyrhizobium sp.]
MILFESYAVPSRSFYIEQRAAPNITAESFAAMPAHMRSEFALLAAERGLAPAKVRDATGIAMADLFRARQEKHHFALSYSEAKVLEEDGPASPHRAGWRKRRAADA